MTSNRAWPESAAFGLTAGAAGPTGRKSVANIEVGHRSSVLPLLGMISWRTGRSLLWDGDKEQIVGDPEASRLLSRPYRAPWVYPDSKV